MASTAKEARGTGNKLWPLALGALGIVYGDIGTSPLYAIRECFHAAHGVPLSPENIFGILSLIFWSLILVISVKYMLFVMRADNRGEGGILALMALVSPQRNRRVSDRLRFLVPMGLFGAALLYGDGIITPSISVLSAVEGLEVVTPVFIPFVLPITVTILALLFLFQKHGTAKIGAVFGPVMLIWFLVLGALGIRQISASPEVLQAVNPFYAWHFFRINQWAGFLVLGSVFLVVTGGEALYADMGHFGRKPIKLAWFTVVLPGLMLNYFGQGSLLLQDPDAITHPFFRMAPEWFVMPLVVLATLATVIASQALISGVFSLTRQAVQLGYLPRVQIIHTSSMEIGQIYIPVVNWFLFLGTAWLVLEFRSSTNMAAAYGVAVTATMFITTMLAYFVARRIWGWRRLYAASLVSLFLIIDLSFLTANLVKIPHGGWFPLVVAAIIFTMMATWQRGREILAQSLKNIGVPFSAFVKEIERHPPVRVPGIAIFMTGDPEGTPVALLHNVKHNKIIHQKVAILTVLTRDDPYIARREKVQVQELGHGFYRIFTYFGFMETPNILGILELCSEQGLEIPHDQIIYFMGRETIFATGKPGMAIWREKLFVFMSRNAQRATAFFNIPPDQVIEVGIQVEI